MDSTGEVRYVVGEVGYVRVHGANYDYRDFHAARWVVDTDGVLTIEDEDGRTRAQFASGGWAMVERPQ